MNRSTSALVGLLVASVFGGGCGSSALITPDDGGRSGPVPTPGSGGSGGTAGGAGGTGGSAGGTGGSPGAPGACVAAAACTLDCNQSCPGGGTVRCACTSGQYVCATCRSNPPGGGVIPDGGLMPTTCPANAQGTQCDPGQPLCVQNAGGAVAALCICRQSTWTCLGGGGGGGGRDGSAPDAARVPTCAAEAQTGAACPTMGAACTSPSDAGVLSGCVCLAAAGGALQWRCNR
jgi:trimeric autotransporter adhesin